ncbi:GNAT family N-acetyltransferase [Phenylobacterium sp.]|uniref:GNAT family N-acetyltransferase n=1 Tax=Phenylobacterium sp. TaxID=1871053 RepID=UPI0035ADB91B
MDPPPKIAVRAMESADVPAIAEVMNQPRAIWGTLQTPYMPVELRQTMFDATDPNRRALVAEVEGRVVGSAGLQREAPHRRGHVASLGMAVHDAFARRGVGSALMAAVVELAERWWNIKRLELHVYADNLPAIALYERFGFEREGLMRAYAWRDGEYVDSLAMARLRL